MNENKPKNKKTAVWAAWAAAWAARDAAEAADDAGVEKLAQHKKIIKIITTKNKRVVCDEDF